MFKFFKSYIKWKLNSIIKDKLIYYLSEKQNYSQEQIKWKYKIYDGKRITKEQFEKQQKNQIQWCSEQWKMYHHKSEALLEILKIIDVL